MQLAVTLAGAYLASPPSIANSHPALRDMQYSGPVGELSDVFVFTVPSTDDASMKQRQWCKQMQRQALCGHPAACDACTSASLKVYDGLTFTNYELTPKEEGLQYPDEKSTRNRCCPVPAPSYTVAPS